MRSRWLVLTPPLSELLHATVQRTIIIFNYLVNANPNPLLNSKIENHANNNAEGIVTESFWPNILKHILADDPDAKPMKAICAICWDELHATCIYSPDDKLDIGIVAACGHIMCSKCWPCQVFDYYTIDLVAKGKCPVCQTKLEYVLCERTCNKEMIPTYGGKASIESFPKTAPECGRVYRHCCKDCA
ncbi:hypothetical protein LZL87_007268 [Fusarium oxysporum]|nr:hypothetical protein LZL87_007268 [Fusarium oxysporum]